MIMYDHEASGRSGTDKTAIGSVPPSERCERVSWHTAQASQTLCLESAATNRTIGHVFNGLDSPPNAWASNDGRCLPASPSPYAPESVTRCARLSHCGRARQLVFETRLSSCSPADQTGLPSSLVMRHQPATTPESQLGRSRKSAQFPVG